MRGISTMASNYDVSYESFRRAVKDKPDVLKAFSKQTKFSVDVAIYWNHMARWLNLSEKEREERGKLKSW